MNLGGKKVWAAAILLAVAGLAVAGYVVLQRLPAAPSANLPPAPLAPPPAAGAGPEVIASNLSVPWALDFAPDGRLFFSERGGSVRVMEAGRLQPEPVANLAVTAVGEGGLLGLVLDPKFQDNHYLYVYHTFRTPAGRLQNRVVRLSERDGRAGSQTVIIDGIPGGQVHDGGRLKFGPDGKLYVTTGDAGVPQLAQDRGSLAGKILRLNADGSVPSDNPFPGSPVYSLGHRNPQGLAWHPATGELWSTEHGQSAADEVNIIKPGANYGWPRVQGAQSDPAYTSPVSQSGTATWAPSGAAFYGSPTSFFFTGLRSQTIWQLTLNNDNRSAKGLEARLQNQFGRLRDVTLGPDGFLYLITNNRDGRGDPVAADDRIIRVKF